MERGACCGAYVSRVSAQGKKKMQRQGFGSERLLENMGAQLEETVWGGEIIKGRKKKNRRLKRVKRIRYQSRGQRKVILYLCCGVRLQLRLLGELNV